MIAPSLSVKGGISTVVSNLLSSPLAQQHDFVLVAPHVDGNRLLKLLKFITALFQSFFILLTSRIDIVYIHGSDIISSSRKYFFFKLARLFNKKSVYHFHGALFREQYAKSPSFIKKRIKSFLEQSDTVICLSKDWKDSLQSIAPGANIKIVPNGVPLPTETVFSSNSSQERTNLLFLGLIGERKGIFDLLAVLGDLDRNGLEYLLTIGGNGDIERLNATIKRYGIESKTNFLGWITGTKKEELFRKSDIFILPSYGEGMPMSILEAMSYGVPVIASNVGGIPEVISDKTTGLLVPPGDRDALRKGLLTLMKDVDLRKRIGQAARKYIADNFSITNQASKIHEIFLVLLEDAKEHDIHNR